MMECIFCSIVDGENDCYRVYEDRDFLAFLDINPLTKGHTLVIPKQHCRWVDEVRDFGKYFEVAQKVGIALKTVFGAHPIYYQTMGSGVPHAHIHVVPRYADDGHEEILDWDKIQEFPPHEMNSTAAALWKHTSSSRPR